MYRDTEQPQSFTHVGQPAGHVQRLADGHIRQRGMQLRQQIAEAIVQTEGVTGGVQRQCGEDVLGDRGIAHHAVGGKGGILRQVGQAGAGGRPYLPGVEQGHCPAGFAIGAPIGQQTIGNGLCGTPV
ncbi:hypothetical protein D3C79_638960 [compost metagenome]